MIRELEKSYQFIRSQLNRQSELIKENSKEALRNLRKLWQRKKKIFHIIGQKVEHLHIDFQKELRVRIDETDLKIREGFQALEHDLKKQDLAL
jgi:hypothetical protein